ncbi:MAG TPA: PaaI family thioesterase [Candidatus Solibacter sp.]|jgi:uncharacterized protein (TIGR00369 family)|nr:PaaI family thioesterase [Candidatus Solibacter sp.]
MEHPRSTIQQEPARGFYIDPGQFVAVSGLDLLRGFFDGRMLPPPMHYLCGLTFTDISTDGAVFTMPASQWLLPPHGVISGAALALLADGPLGCAVQVALPPATPYTTAEISMTFLRPVAADDRPITGTGRLIHAGRTLAVSECTITDADGNVVALSSTRCVIQRRMDAPKEMVDQALANPPHPVEPEWPTPHPYLRPAEGEVLPQESWDRMSGLEVLQKCSSGELPAPPICRLLGVWPTEVDAGRTTWTMPATEWMCSPVEGRLYGGAIAYVAGNAIDGAFTTLAPPGTAIAPLDLKVYFTRPVAPDGRDLTARSEITHRGRTLAIGTSEVVDADGKRVAVATASAMLLPGRPASLSRGIAPAEAAEL